MWRPFCQLVDEKKEAEVSALIFLQCFDTVIRMMGRASGV